jgi:hypothetical protein
MLVGLTAAVRLPDPEPRTKPTVCPLCHGGNIMCAYHAVPLGHDGCEDPGMPCPRCAMKPKPAP